MASSRATLAQVSLQPPNQVLTPHRQQSLIKKLLVELRDETERLIADHGEPLDMVYQGQHIGVAREEPEKVSLPDVRDRETAAGEVAIQGFEKAVTDHEAAKNWRPVSDRKIRVGIAGYGVCNFGAAFHFQDHPNVTVAAVAEIDPDKCAEPRPPGIRTEKGTFYSKFQNDEQGHAPTEFRRPPLPPGVEAGGHGGSHGYLMSEFVEAILLDRTPLIDVAQSLDMTVSGIVAYQSALKDGELLKIPQYTL